jgi:subfamily B ATP-binding cassette protein HlyB/CyaB
VSEEATIIGRENFVWALGSLCRLYRIAFDRDLLLQQFPAPHTLAALQRAAHSFGFGAEAVGAARAELNALDAPCLLLREDGPALVIATEGENAVTLEPSGAQHRTPRTALLASVRRAGIIRFSPPTARDDALTPEPRAGRFGFRWFAPELLRYAPVWREVMLASAAIQLLGLGVPLLTQVVVDKVVVHQTLNTLLVIGLALAVALVFGAIMSWARQYLVLHTGNRVDAVLGMRVFEHLMQLPPRYFERRPTGTLVARLQGVETIREFVSGAAITLVLDFPFLLAYLALLFWYSGQLTLVTLGILAAIVAMSLAVAPLIRSRLDRQFLLGARNQAFLTEYLAGIETVKSLQMEPQLRRRYSEQLGSYLEAGFRTRTLSNAYGVLANALEQLLVVLVLCLGAWMVMQNDGFTIGMLVAFQMITGRMTQPVMRMVGLWQELQQASIAVRRLGDIMNAPAEPNSTIPGGARDAEAEIEIESLGFRYADNTPFLYRGLNARMRKGSCVALMGPSGCGKSTLARLMQGFHVPTEGAVRIGGRDIRNLPANELRAYFGVVPQETVLFSGTVYENLILGGIDAEFDDVVQACRLAEIHQVIERLPQGYQTLIGEHGSGLSVGQKQRLAVARALLRRAPILLFDEATASLDAETAEQLARTISALRGKVTVVFIAHQLPRGLVVDDTVALAGALEACP